MCSQTSETVVALPQHDGGKQPPLILDLDGTLLRTDLLVEGIVNAFFHKPLQLVAALPLALISRSRFKHRIASITEIDINSMPVNSELVAYAGEQKKLGRDIHLYTASSQSLADKVKARFDFLDTALGSSEKSNLKAARKSDALKEHFPDGFVYAGDTRADLPVWEDAQAAILVDVPKSVNRAVVNSGKEIEARFRNSGSPLKSWLKAMRIHQWAKNALIFVPLLLSHQYLDPAAVVRSVAAFFVLSIAASGTYILNDLADLSADRRHQVKRNRPFASGKLNLLAGLVLAIFMVSGGLVAGAFVSPGFFFALSSYLILTLAYSFGLKRVPVLDVVILATLFTLRLAMGTEASATVYSEWLLTFSMFFFLSLSMAKRYVEVAARSENCGELIGGRGYRGEDRMFVSTMGIGTGVASLLILVLFLREDAFKVNIYQTKGFLWGIPVVMSLFLGRVWLLASRQELHDDPVAFAVKDKTSYLLGFALVVCMLAAILVPS
ncbi:MAG: hypothetical protein VR75_08710 [Hyphomonadaceae bacterium BRH_c29]|nr:MAG: hypothetical protein VR75_08710 [Hyphomonadaceae bacterium BRH_c29]